MELRYKGNPKHKEPWQPGRRGSLCPPDVDQALAQGLLDQSELDGAKRYATHDGRAFCGQSEDDGRHWHGYPVGWVEVPESLRQRFVRRGVVKRSDIKRNWKTHV
jgi:hypothetical protein